MTTYQYHNHIGEYHYNGTMLFNGISPKRGETDYSIMIAQSESCTRRACKWLFQADLYKPKEIQKRDHARDMAIRLLSYAAEIKRKANMIGIPDIRGIR